MNNYWASTTQKQCVLQKIKTQKKKQRAKQFTGWKGMNKEQEEGIDNTVPGTEKNECSFTRGNG